MRRRAHAPDFNEVMRDTPDPLERRQLARAWRQCCMPVAMYPPEGGRRAVWDFCGRPTFGLPGLQPFCETHFAAAYGREPPSGGSP